MVIDGRDKSILQKGWFVDGKMYGLMVTSKGNKKFNIYNIFEDPYNVSKFQKLIKVEIPKKLICDNFEFKFADTYAKECYHQSIRIHKTLNFHYLAENGYIDLESNPNVNMSEKYLFFKKKDSLTKYAFMGQFDI